MGLPAKIKPVILLIQPLALSEQPQSTITKKHYDSEFRKKLTFVSNVKRTRKMLYPIGIQDFVKIRKDGYVYVDKTDLVYKMVQKGGYYFLIRPRRFGNLLIRKMNNDLLTGKPDDFMKRMEAFFARQNYQIQGNAEKDFQYASCWERTSSSIPKMQPRKVV